MVNWSEHAKYTLPFNCSNKDNTRQKRLRRLLLRVKKCRRAGI